MTETGQGNLISDEARTWIGRGYPPRTIPVGRNDIVRFAIATGEDDPVHHDVEAARAAGYRDILAPPGFVSVLAAHSQLFVDRSRLRGDGLVEEQYPPLPVRRIVVGEIALRFHADICAGDEITVAKTLVDMNQRQARDGAAMVVIDFERRYLDASGSAVADERYAVVVR